MTTTPADLLGFRRATMAETGITDPTDVGIVGDGIHQRTGGYHEGRDILAAIGRYHPGDQYIGAATEDYSARRARDRAGLTNDASGVDIGANWPRGGRAAWLRFNRMLVAALQVGDATLAAIRAVNFSRDGIERKRIDREHGLNVIDDSTDSVTTHTHMEFYRDTVGRRQATFDRLAAMMRAAVTNTRLESAMALMDDPTYQTLTARDEALTRGLPTVRYGPTAGEPVWLVRQVQAMQTALAASAARETALAAAVQALVTGGTSIDTAAVIAHADKLAAAESVTVQALHVELAALRAAQAAGARAEADALDPQG